MTKQIELTQGQFAIVDDDVYEWASQWKWQARRSRNTFYAVRNAGVWPLRKKKSLHREILNAPDGVKVDHIDGNGLNCVRSNMRLATNSQNLRNRGATVNNKSGYKGVSWDKRDRKWKAKITVNGKQIHIVNFTDPIKLTPAAARLLRAFFLAHGLRGDLLVMFWKKEMRV